MTTLQHQTPRRDINSLCLATSEAVRYLLVDLLATPPIPNHGKWMTHIKGSPRSRWQLFLQTQYEHETTISVGDRHSPLRLWIEKGYVCYLSKEVNDLGGPIYEALSPDAFIERLHDEHAGNKAVLLQALVDFERDLSTLRSHA